MRVSRTFAEAVLDLPDHEAVLKPKPSRLARFTVWIGRHPIAAAWLLILPMMTIGAVALAGLVCGFIALASYMTWMPVTGEQFFAAACGSGAVGCFPGIATAVAVINSAVDKQDDRTVRRITE